MAQQVINTWICAFYHLVVNHKTKIGGESGDLYNYQQIFFIFGKVEPVFIHRYSMISYRAGLAEVIYSAWSDSRCICSQIADLVQTAIRYEGLEESLVQFDPQSAIFVFNKWDLVLPEQADDIRREGSRMLRRWWPDLRENQIFSLCATKVRDNSIC